MKSKSVICHIRQANSGEVCLENTHPFTRQMWGRNWTYAHNGQLADFQNKLPIKYHLPIGTTDSEHAFCWLLDQVYLAFGENQPDFNTLFTFIAEYCNKIESLGVGNFIITDGEYLFSYCSNNLHYLVRKAPFGHASLIDAEIQVDFNEETTKDDIVAVIATQPLTNDESWHKMVSGEWHVFHLGESTLRGNSKAGS
jgi:glutamine amidotransferase